MTILLKSIELQYRSSAYWDKCSQITMQKVRSGARNVSIKTQNIDSIGVDIASMIKKQLVGVSCVNININTQFTGEIKQMHVAHSDVAVGVAECGSTVFHHKIVKNGRK